MYKPKNDKDIRCPMDYGLDILSGKWNVRVISLLGYKGALRFKDIRQGIPDISEAVLSATLKELTNLGIVTRVAYSEIPPRTEYFLSPKGRSVTPILNAICRWSGQFHDNIADNALEQCKTCTYYKQCSGSS